MGTKRKEKLKTETVYLGTRLPTWNKKVFMTIARDRGYLSESSVIRDIAQKFKIAKSTAEQMLYSGRFTWERLLVLGAMFEMTPREFCGCFLDDYFREDEQGHFVATVDNEPLMVQPIPKTVHTKKEWESFFAEDDK